jgi:hypothetical protein
MSLIKDLHSEAVRRGLLEPNEEIDAARAFALVRDMPYMRASSRAPQVTIREWRGTCSGKHYLLKELFAELGLRSRLIACTTETNLDPAEMPEELRALVGDAGGRVVDVHNYLVLELPEGDMVVDATWPLALKELGMVVNEEFRLGENQHIAGKPIEEWVVPEGGDPQEFKDVLLREHFTPEELELRDEFIRAFSQVLLEYLGEDS